MRAAVPLLLMLLLAAPLAAAQGVGGPAPPPADTGYDGPPVTVRLYGHIFDLLQPVPMNTQPMIDMDIARGFGTPGVPGAGDGSLHEMRFYSSPGLVEYNVSAEEPRVHPERGVSFDILLDPAAPLVGYWHMGVKPLDAPQAGQTDGPERGLVPNLTVCMALRVGDDIGADLDAGELIAEGCAARDLPDEWVADGPIEFVIDLGKPLLERIPGDEAFNVKVWWFNAETPEGRIVQRDWVLHTGARYPNRVEVSVANPIAIYDVRAVPVGRDQIALRTQVNSPLGNYDVDVETLEVRVEGPSPAPSVSAPRIVQKAWIHNHHYEPVDATWLWDWRADGAAPGEYTVTVAASNLQGTARAEKAFTFRLEGDRLFDSATGEEIVPAGEEPAPEREAPAGFLALPLAALAACVFLNRRRPRE